MKKTLLLAFGSLLLFTNAARAELRDWEELAFKPKILACYKYAPGAMPCQWIVPSEYDTVKIPIEHIADVNSTEVWQGHWQETVMAEGVYFTYTIKLLKQIEKTTGETHFEIGFAIRNTANTNTFFLQLENDKIQNLGSVHVEASSVIGDKIELYPHLHYGRLN